MMTHRSSGIHHTFQLHTFHCWSTVAKKRNGDGSTGHRHGKRIHKRNENVSWERKREKYKIWFRLKFKKKHGEQAGRHFSADCLKAAFVLSDRSGRSLGLSWPLKHFFMSCRLHLLPTDLKGHAGRYNRMQNLLCRAGCRSEALAEDSVGAKTTI